MTIDEQYDDLSSKADEMAPQVQPHFGRIAIASKTNVVLQKGVRGGVPFNPVIHRPEQRAEMIKIEFSCLRLASAQMYPWRQEAAHFDRKWARVTLPSWKRAGLPLPISNAEGCWVRFKMTPTGEKYTRNGVEELAMGVLIEEYFPTEEDCRNAHIEYHIERNGGLDGSAAATDDYPEADAEVEPSASNERSIAEQAVKALWQAANGSEVAFKAMLKSNSAITKSISVEDALKLVGAA